MKKYCVVLLLLLLALFLLSCDSDNNEAESSGESRDQFVRADGEVYYVGEGFDVYEPKDVPLPEKEIVSEDYSGGFHTRYYNELSSDELNDYFDAARDAGYQVVKHSYDALLYNEDNYVEVHYNEYGAEDEVLTSVTCYGKKESFGGMISPDEAILVIGRTTSFTPVDITPREVFQKFGFQFFIQPFEDSSYGYKSINSVICFISKGRSNELGYRNLRVDPYVIADADSDGKVELWTIGSGPTSGVYTVQIEGYADGIVKYFSIIGVDYGTYTISENDGKLCFAEDGGEKYGLLLNKSSGDIRIDTKGESNHIRQLGSDPAVFGAGAWLELPCSKDHVDEFLSAFEKIKKVSYPANEDGYTYEKCFNVTPRTVYEQTGVRIFKFSDSFESFALIDDEVYEICNSLGGLGFIGAVPWDYDKDGTTDLVVGGSWGSGMHRSEISVFNVKTKESLHVVSSIDYVSSGLMDEWIPIAELMPDSIIVDAVVLNFGEDLGGAYKTVERVGEITLEDGKPVFKKYEIESEPSYNDAGKTYVWEKEGFGGDFTITLDEDGKYTYYVGYLSSYIGMGEWKIEDGVLTLTENSGYDLTFRFRVGDGELVYIKEGSSEFMHVTVEDGDRFVLTDE